jgi:hypothetical protein
MNLRGATAIAASTAIGIATVGALITFASLVGIGVGALVGAIAGLFFPGTIGLIGSAIAGGATMPAWQVGAVLGFVGAFFKSTFSAHDRD